MQAARSTERGETSKPPRQQSAESLENSCSINKSIRSSMTPKLKKASFSYPLQRMPEEADHQPDDDTPRPPELNALSSPQARRVWRETDQ